MSYGEYSISVAVNRGNACFLHGFALKKKYPKFQSVQSVKLVAFYQ